MARSMRKRCQEKQRRSDVNLQFTALIEILRKNRAEYDSDSDDDDDESDDDSVVTPPTKRITTKQVFASHRTTSTDEKN